MKYFIFPVLLAAPALAGFPQTTQRVALSYGQQEAVIVFTTDGAAITKAKAHCDCTDLQNAGTRLIATVDTSKFEGRVSKTIDATTADGKTTRLTMQFDVPPAIVLSTRSLQWKVGSTPAPKVLTITLPKGSPVKGINDAGLNGEAFDYRPQTVTKGREYRITVTPLSTAKPVLNRLVIKADSSDPRYAQQIIYLQVRK